MNHSDTAFLALGFVLSALAIVFMIVVKSNPKSQFRVKYKSQPYK